MSRNVSDADRNHIHHCGDTSLVPEGLYCYRIKEIIPQEYRSLQMSIQTCAYWGRRQIEEGTYGYCAHLKLGDWHDDGPLSLHDMVKECGINMGDDLKSGTEGMH
jgi:hypothetical protein